MSSLFSPLTIRSVSFRNRITVSPMCQYSASEGLANDWHLVHLGSRAVGGAGLIIAEATAVVPEGRISPDDLGIWNDAQIAPLRRITSFIHAHGAVAGIQLAHAGRKAGTYAAWKGHGQVPFAEGGWQTVAPSPIPFHEKDHTPAELDEHAIAGIVSSFTAAAVRSTEAGFRVIEIHAAHGYLIHQFLSPLSNKRTDGYGGSFENRIRLLLEICTAVRAAIPEGHPLFVRISATDWNAEGWTGDDSVQLAVKLKEAGADLIDCSTGAILPKIPIPVAPLYQLPFAERIRSEAGIRTAAVGLITNTAEAERIIRNGQADLIMMGRELLRNPYFPLTAAGAPEDLWPAQYLRSRPESLK